MKSAFELGEKIKKNRIVPNMVIILSSYLF